MRSQVTQIKDLQVQVIGKNKQILKGYIPQVLLSCDRATYQGLYLSQIELNGLDIAVNLPEVIKKQPLRLVEPIFVEIQLKLGAADLQASLDSELLRSGLDDLWQMILSAQTDTSSRSLADMTVEWHSIAIANENLHLAGTYQDTSGGNQELSLSTGINLANNQTLCLSPLKITSESLLSGNLENQLEIDLGTDVAIEELTIESEQIVCAGKIRINN